MPTISQKLKYIDSSEFQKAIHKQQTLQNPLDLSIGIPEELTPEHIKAAGIKAIRQDKTTYTPTNGLLELRAALSQKLARENNIHYGPDNITIVPGLTTGQLLVYLAILDPGDEVIVFDPYYPPYAHLATMAGAQVTYVSTLPTFQPDLPALEASITHKTKMIIINSPNNPTGAVYSEDTLRKIAAIADKHNILLVSDEIYEHFVYDDAHFSVGSIYPNTLTMNGFSKEYAMTGWRIGYVAGPSEIINAINELQQYVVMSSSSIAQHAALAALQHRTDLTPKYRDKRNLVTDKLTEAGINVQGANGSFYVFFKAPNDMTDLEFVEMATDHNLILVPGRVFSQLHGYVRMSYGANIHTLKNAMSVLETMIKSSR